MPIHLNSSGSYKTAWILLSLIALLFIVAGCAQFYAALGLTEEDCDDQVRKDSTSRKEILDDARMTITELATTAIAGAGTILSVLLGRLLGRERKITQTLITGVEKASVTETKKAIKTEAIANGINGALSKRVAALT